MVFPLTARGSHPVAGASGPSAKDYDTAVSGGSNVDNIDVPIPSAASGDLLIVCLGHEGSSITGWTGPTGWTLIAEGGSNPSFSAWRKVSDGTETTVNFDWSSTGQTKKTMATCLNLGPATFDTASLRHANREDPSVLNGITMANSNSWSIAVAYDKRDTDPANDDWFDPPSGFTEWFEFGNGTERGKMCVGYESGVGSGATGDQNWVMNTPGAGDDIDRVYTIHIGVY